MHNSRCEEPRTRIIICFAACCLLSSQLLAQSAGSDSPVLVVVEDTADAACVQRIGGKHVQVMCLFAPESGEHANNYAACNERVRGMLEFGLFIVRGNGYCERKSFWRERLTAANPDGEVFRLSQSRCLAANNCDRWIHQATEIHRALTAKLPQRKDLLDANLKAEIERLYSLRVRAVRFVSRD